MIARRNWRANIESQATRFSFTSYSRSTSSAKSSRFVGKLRRKARYTLLLLFLARRSVGPIGSSHVVGKLRTKARYTLLLLFLARRSVGPIGSSHVVGKLRTKARYTLLLLFLARRAFPKSLKVGLRYSALRLGGGSCERSRVEIVRGLD